MAKQKSFKISFDFDECLNDNIHIQNLAKILVNTDCEIFILTSRVNDGVISNNDLFNIAKEIGISLDNIIFVGTSNKYLAMKKHNITLHFDDNADTVDRINRHFDSPLSTNKRAVLVNFVFEDVVNTFPIYIVIKVQ